MDSVGGCISARRFSYGQIPAISRRYCRPAFLPEGENRKCKSSPGCMLIPTRSDVKCRRIMAVARVTVPIFRMYRRPTSVGVGFTEVFRMTLSITERRGFAHRVSNRSRFFLLVSLFFYLCFLLLVSSGSCGWYRPYLMMKGKRVDNNVLPVSLL